MNAICSDRGLEIIIFKWSHAGEDKYHLYVESKKNDTNKHIYKTEIESDIENKLIITKRENSRGRGSSGREREIKSFGLTHQLFKKTPPPRKKKEQFGKRCLRCGDLIIPQDCHWFMQSPSFILDHFFSYFFFPHCWCPIQCVCYMSLATSLSTVALCECLTYLHKLCCAVFPHFWLLTVDWYSLQAVTVACLLISLVVTGCFASDSQL